MFVKEWCSQLALIVLLANKYTLKLCTYDYSDTFWNTERLSKQIPITDAITIATAIREIK